jgi:hypothetical protein
VATVHIDAASLHRRKVEHLVGDAVRAGISIAAVARTLGLAPRTLRDMTASDAALHDAVNAARLERQANEAAMLEQLRQRLDRQPPA